MDDDESGWWGDAGWEGIDLYWRLSQNTMVPPGLIVAGFPDDVDIKAEPDDEDIRIMLSCVSQVSLPSGRKRKYDDMVRHSDHSYCQQGESNASSLKPSTGPRDLSSGLLHCFYCGYSSLTKTDLGRHMQGHLPRHVCVSCNGKFQTEWTFRAHMLPSPAPRRCQWCEFKFETDCNLSLHVKRWHKLNKPYACNMFGCSTKHDQKLAIHKVKNFGEKHLGDPSGCTPKFPSSGLLQSYCDYTGGNKPGSTKHIQLHTPPHICDTCDATFQTARTLKLHMQSEHGDTQSDVTHKCAGCSFKCKTKFELIHHTREQHSRDKAYTCDMCDFRSQYYYSLERHKRIHARSKPCDSDKGLMEMAKMVCYYCQWTTDRRDVLVAHMRNKHLPSAIVHNSSRDFHAKNAHTLNGHKMESHRVERPYACDTCDFRTKYKWALTKHKKTHTRSKLRGSEVGDLKREKLMCYYCQWITDIKDVLVAHIRNNHLSTVFDSCGLCGFLAENECTLKKHKAESHGVERPYACDTCDFRTKYKWSLQKHKKTHTRSKLRVSAVVDQKKEKLICHYCQWTTDMRDVLVAHIQNNHILVFHSCEQCGFIAKSKSTLKKHDKENHREKRYECDTCEFSTKYGYNLKEHKRRRHARKSIQPDAEVEDMTVSHDVKKFYACELCDYRCRFPHLLRYHKEKHSNDEPYACEHCPYRTPHRQLIKKHVDTHLDVRPYACDECDARLSSNFALKQHKAIHAGTYDCDMCDFKGKRPEYLVAHKRVHTGERPYACPYCGWRFARSSDLWKHKKTHTGERPHLCKVCGHRFLNSNHLKAHRRVHTGEKPYKCDLCDYSARRKQSLNIHKRLHDGKFFVCDQCDFKSVRNADLTKHKMIHVPEKECETNTKRRIDGVVVRKRKSTPLNKHKCDICVYKTVSLSFMASHMATHERTHTVDGSTNTNRYVCDLCDYSTSTIMDMSSHKRTHPSEKPLPCALCSFRTTKTNLLKVHYRIHTGEKPYGCTQCGYTTHLSQSLSSHLKLHADYKPHKCDICGYRTDRPNRLVIHLRKHTGEKPFACATCGYKCSERQQLREHLRNHSGEKPYSCDWCDFTAKTAHLLLIHKRAKHLGNMYSCGECSFQDFSRHKVELHLKMNHPRLDVGIPGPGMEPDVGIPGPGMESDVDIPSPVTEPAKAKSTKIKLVFKCPECSFKDAIRSQVLGHILICHPEVTETKILPSTSWESD